MEKSFLIEIRVIEIYHSLPHLGKAGGINLRVCRAFGAILKRH
jgi:hypothetical protein